MANKAATNEKVVVEPEMVIVYPVLEKDGEYSPLPKTDRKATRKITSEFKLNNGRVTSNIIRGLNPDQERVFLPNELGISTDSVDWDEKVKNFWAEYSVIVPKDGLPINKASYLKEVTIDGNKKEIDYPVNLHDYMMYNFMLESSKVAKTPDQKANLDLHLAYLEDVSELNKKKVSLLEEKDKADANYVTLISNRDYEAKIEWLIEKFRNPDENYSMMSLQDKKMLLREVKDKNPVQFNTEFENEDLEYEAFLFQLVRLEILKKEGNLYFNGNVSLGGEKETLAYIKDPLNSDNINKFKSLLAERKKAIKNI